MSDRLTVMTWNVLFGGQGRFERIVALLRAVRPDLLALQECLEWERNDRLQRVAEALGVPATPEHARLGFARPRGSGACYHVALLSRRPMSDVRVHADPAFLGHCLVEARVGALRVFATHLDSHHENLRFVEARYLRSLLPPRDELARQPALLLGDLNSLSRRDP